MQIVQCGALGLCGLSIDDAERIRNGQADNHLERERERCNNVNHATTGAAKNIR